MSRKHVGAFIPVGLVLTFALCPSSWAQSGRASLRGSDPGSCNFLGRNQVALRQSPSWDPACSPPGSLGRAGEPRHRAAPTCASRAGICSWARGSAFGLSHLGVKSPVGTICGKCLSHLGYKSQWRPCCCGKCLRLSKHILC